MHDLGEHVPVYAVIPFVLTLLGIAVLPLAAGHWWEKNQNKAVFASLMALPVALYLALNYPAELLHTGREYAAFVALLGALFAISGGIHVSGDLEGKPSVNLGMLALGAVLASGIGTTGASMVLIRTLLRTNRQRKNTAHLPFFFILLVSNCGGLLTPLGDPPLFLGYLRGVPFTWTFSLWPAWLLAVSYLLAVFYVVDRRAYAAERREDLARDVAQQAPIRVTGAVNLVLLAGVIGCVLLPHAMQENGAATGLMLVLALLSIVLAPAEPRRANGFTYAPILEVAILFAGIFVTMVPALALLEVHGGSLGIREPWQFFLASGVLSSVLDNAPTYLTFLSAAQGLPLAEEVVGIPNVFLAAISLGSVFMGANTYIGNGPNFMVKAIADESGYKTYSFFGYAARATLTLAPVYALLVAYLLFGSR